MLLLPLTLSLPSLPGSSVLLLFPSILREPLSLFFFLFPPVSLSPLLKTTSLPLSLSFSSFLIFLGVFRLDLIYSRAASSALLREKIPT